MTVYLRPAVPEWAFTDAAGDPVHYGNRWGASGPPDDTYSVSSHPERFAPLHAVADALIAFLSEAFEVEVEDALELGTVLIHEPREVVRAVRLSPKSPDGAPLTFVLTDYPGVILAAGVLHEFPYPACGCDACDETWESQADELEKTVFAVVTGGYQERYERDAQLPVINTLVAADGSESGTGASLDTAIQPERLQAAANKLESLPDGWQPWPASPGQVEEPLPGGGTTLVVRVGDTVRRETNPWSTRVHRLLEHLANAGFSASPRFLGLDAKAREVLTYIDGEVGNYPLSHQVRSDSALTSAARLLRRYHDATVELASETEWRQAPREPVEVVCHGDFAPYNCVFENGVATGLIDFDFAHPGPRAWDLAYAVYRFAPLTDSSEPDGFGSSIERARRARAFLDAYGADTDLREQTVDLLDIRLQSLVDLMTTLASGGDANFEQHIAAGDRDLYLRDIDYLRANRNTWDEVISGKGEPAE